MFVTKGQPMKVFSFFSSNRLRNLVLAFLVWGLTGCSSFNREWKAAGMQTWPKQSMEGRWEGTWNSEATGHHERLRCLITHRTNDVYLANFQAKYKKVFVWTFSYGVDLTVKPEDDGFQFQGEEDLGALAGGIYRYEGHATSTNFYSTYRSPYDRGTFQMKRPTEQ